MPLIKPMKRKISNLRYIVFRKNITRLMKLIHDILTCEFYRFKDPSLMNYFQPTPFCGYPI